MGIFKWHQKHLLSRGGGGIEREGTGHQMTNKGESKIAGGVFLASLIDSETELR